MQWQAKVPPWAKVNVKLCPGLRLPESNDPSSAVTVCGEVSLLVQVTVVPAATLKVGGSKAKFAIVTACRPPPPGVGVAVGESDGEVVGDAVGGGTDVATAPGQVELARRSSLTVMSRP